MHKSADKAHYTYEPQYSLQASSSAKSPLYTPSKSHPTTTQEAASYTAAPQAPNVLHSLTLHCKKSDWQIRQGQCNLKSSGLTWPIAKELQGMFSRPDECQGLPPIKSTPLHGKLFPRGQQKGSCLAA